MPSCLPYVLKHLESNLENYMCMVSFDVDEEKKEREEKEIEMSLNEII